MDAERERIEADLRGLVDGDVHCDDLTQTLYASDASIYSIRPLGVVCPRTTADVVACVGYASENAIPVHARGAGTGLSGESLGPGIVLDFSRYMRRILRTDESAVRVQPGVVHALLNQHLSARGRQFGPDPATSSVTTMGSVISVDAGGSHRLRYGSARQHVQSLQVVLADGSVLEVGRESRSGDPARHKSARHLQLVEALEPLFARNIETIAKYRSACAVNHSGYMVDGVLEERTLNLPKLLSGSEGTLALITEATLATQSAPAFRGIALLLFERLESAARAVQEILPFEPSACDLMDRRHLSLARETDVRYDLLIPAEAEAVLLVEQEGETADEVRDSLTAIVDRVRRRKRLAFGAHQTMDVDEIELFWRLARKFVPTLYRLRGSTRPLPFVEDMAVPPAALPEFLVRIQNILKQHQVIASLFAHAGHGQLHVRPFLDLGSPEDVQRIGRLAQDCYREVWEVGGTISGEHADGLSRTPFVREQAGPLYPLFCEIKHAFDPMGVLNPGKIVSNSTTTMLHNLRPVQPVSAAVASPGFDLDHDQVQLPILEPQLDWSASDVAYAARQCNGCGACRSQTGDVRMCPIFHVGPQEAASPRAKANLLRGVLTGALDAETLLHEDLKEVADLCVHCHQCRLECPANVDIPRLMVEAKAAYVRTNGFQLGDGLMARIDTLSSLGSRLPRLSNWALSNRLARWVLEKTMGIAQGRKLPRFASRNFLRLAGRRRITKPTRRSGAKVLYLVDTYANYHDTQLAEAVVAVLEHNGIAVYVHPDQWSAGMPMIAQGAVEMARRVAAHNLPLLSEAVRQGYHIIASEPSAALCLRHEYRNLIDDEDAQTVAANTSDVCEYLWDMHQQGKLQLDFKPQTASLGYHMPCHLRALGIGTPGLNLLRLVPGLAVREMEKGCSGMAGTYGLQRNHYRNSLRAGWKLISAIRELPIQAGTTECSTCKMQMEQGTSKPTVHPIKLLASAYGLMPELSQSLFSPGEDLVVT